MIATTGRPAPVLVTAVLVTAVLDYFRLDQTGGAQHS
jgi:hypothetical protein